LILRWFGKPRLCSEENAKIIDTGLLVWENIFLKKLIFGLEMKLLKKSIPFFLSKPQLGNIKKQRNQERFSNYTSRITGFV